VLLVLSASVVGVGGGGALILPLSLSLWMTETSPETNTNLNLRRRDVVCVNRTKKSRQCKTRMIRPGRRKGKGREKRPSCLAPPSLFCSSTAPFMSFLPRLVSALLLCLLGREFPRKNTASYAGSLLWPKNAFQLFSTLSLDEFLDTHRTKMHVTPAVPHTHRALLITKFRSVREWRVYVGISNNTVRFPSLSLSVSRHLSEVHGPHCCAFRPPPLSLRRPFRHATNVRDHHTRRSFALDNETLERHTLCCVRSAVLEYFFVWCGHGKHPGQTDR